MINLICLIISMEKKFESNCFNNKKSIDSLFKQLSDTHEFKNMMNNISTTIGNLNDSNETPLNDTISNKSSSLNIEKIFISKNNNNICDCLENVNDTLNKILMCLEKKK